MVVSQERGPYRYRRLLLPHTIRRSVVADHAASTTRRQVMSKKIQLTATFFIEDDAPDHALTVIENRVSSWLEGREFVAEVEFVDAFKVKETA